MKEPPEDIKIRMLYILHRGFVEIRNLAQPENVKQIFDLSDVMEYIPKLLNDWEPENFEVILSDLKKYEEKYKGRCYNYTDYIDKYDVPLKF